MFLHQIEHCIFNYMSSLRHFYILPEKRLQERDIKNTIRASNVAFKHNKHQEINDEVRTQWPPSKKHCK